MAAPSKLVASTVWRNLNGLLCLYKPPEITLGRLIQNVRLILPSGLNNMITRQPRKLMQYDEALGVPMETLETDYSDHPLVIGSRYEKDDVRYYCASALSFYASGVCVIGLNRGRHLAMDLENSKPIRVYHLVGKLGRATDNLFKTGRVVERATYAKVFRPVVDRVVAAMQASHQRHMYMNSGVHLQSQAAYELAVKGLLRPADDRVPIIYGIRCVEFDRPSFTIEVTCINEREEYLLNLVHMIGMKLGTVATCECIKCIRYGPFTLEHALLQHAWKAEKFASNVQMCNVINEQDINSGRRENINLLPLNVGQNKEDSLGNESDDSEHLDVTRPQVRYTAHRERRRLKKLNEEVSS